jgi:hypothetical protein
VYEVNAIMRSEYWKFLKNNTKQQQQKIKGWDGESSEMLFSV